MPSHQRMKLGAVAVSCLAIGGGASAIATAGANPSAAHADTTATKSSGIARRLLARTVQGHVVVATKTGFATVGFERGIVRAVSGHSLTLAEGTTTKTYRTVTVTIPADARVRDNGAKSTLGAIGAGERVLVIDGPKRTLVRARTA